MNRPSHQDLSAYFNASQRVVSLPGIDMEVELPKRTWFKYDGEVSSLLENLAEAECRVRGVISPHKNRFERIIDAPLDYFARREAAAALLRADPGIIDLAAYQRAYDVGSRTTAHVIAKKRGLERSKSVFADGHESGEFLQAAGLKNLLQSELDARGIRLKAADFSGEDYADIGGMIALRKAADEGCDGIALPVFRTRNAVLRVIAEQFGM